MAERNNSTARKAIKGLSTQTLVTIVMGVVEIVAFSIMSRLLTETDFGYYSAMVAIAAIFSSLSDTGIGSAIVQRKDLDDKFINVAFSASFFVGIILAGLLCLSSGILAENVADSTIQKPLMLFSTTLLFTCISSVDISLLQRDLKFLSIGGIRLTALIISTAIAVILALRGYGYYAILAKTIVNALLIALLAKIVSKSKYKFAFDLSIFKQLFGFSGWLMLSAFFRNIAGQIDRLLMSSLFSVNALGIYSRPKDFITSLSQHVNNIFDSVLFPVFSGIQDEQKKMINSYRYTLYFLNLVGLMLTLVLFFNSELIIRIFFGCKWLSYNTLFQILALTPICLINGRISDIFLRTLGMTKQQFLYRVFQMIIVTVFVFWGGKFGGMFGVAIGYMLGYMSIVIAKMVVLSKRIGLSFGESCKTILSSYQILIIITPLYLIIQNIMPTVLSGNIMKAALFFVVVALCFLVIPATVGNIYKNYAHAKVVKVIKTKIKVKQR